MRPLVVDFLPKALLAIACGGLIGVEREMKSKPAGFRTNILICLGSMLFMWLSTQVAMVIATGRPADPGRIAAQASPASAFPGAGGIIKSRGAAPGRHSEHRLQVSGESGRPVWWRSNVTGG